MTLKVTKKIISLSRFERIAKRGGQFDNRLESGVLEQQVRAALVPYFLQAMRINHDDLTRNTVVQLIVLLNRDKLSKFLVF